MKKNRKKGVTMHLAREILRLRLSCNAKISDIAKSCKIDQKTVRNYLTRVEKESLTYPQIQKLNDEQLNDLLKSRRGRKLDPIPQPDFSNIHHELKKKGVTLQLLWEEYSQENQGGYKRSQFCYLYQQWKNKLNPSMRQNHVAGEKLFVDYSGQTIPIKDRETGANHNAQIFVAVLGASNYTYAEATYGQSLPDWIQSHVNTFRFLKGVPALVVPDNLKSGVSKACRYDPEINREYHEMAVHYQTAIMPARVRAPKDKSKAENGVLLIQRWILAIFRNRVFFSLNELNQEISKLIVKVNERPFKKMEGSRKSLFESLDQPALKALPLTPYVFAEWKRYRVRIDYHVELKEHFYSVPFKYINEMVEIRYSQKTVEIFFNTQRIASHLRDDTSGTASSLIEHMPEKHKKYLEWTPVKILNHAKEIGESTFGVIQHFLETKQHQAIAYRAAVGVIRLEKRYSSQRLEMACKKALRINGVSYKSIQSILKHSLDLKENDYQKQLQSSVSPPHDNENVRGEGYYSKLIKAKGERPC